MITIQECKQQCSIEQTILDFEPWFRRTIPAAVATVKAQINRPLYETQALLDADLAALAEGDNSLGTALVVTEDLRHAMLMLIAHWFENRESGSPLTIKDVPMGFDFLVEPHRCISI